MNNEGSGGELQNLTTPHTLILGLVDPGLTGCVQRAPFMSTLAQL